MDILEELKEKLEISKIDAINNELNNIRKNNIHVNDSGYKEEVMDGVMRKYTVNLKRLEKISDIKKTSKTQQLRFLEVYDFLQRQDLEPMDFLTMVINSGYILSRKDGLLFTELSLEELAIFSITTVLVNDDNYSDYKDMSIKEILDNLYSKQMKKDDVLYLRKDIENIISILLTKENTLKNGKLI